MNFRTPVLVQAATRGVAFQFGGKGVSRCSGFLDWLLFRCRKDGIQLLFDGIEAGDYIELRCFFAVTALALNSFTAVLTSIISTD